MQSAAGAQLSHPYSRNHHSKPSSTTSYSLSSRSSPPPSFNTSTLHSDDLPKPEAINTSQQLYTDTKYTSSLIPLQCQGLPPLSRSLAGPPRKRRKIYLSRSLSLDRGSNIYKHWTTKSFKPSLAIEVPTNPTHTQSLWQLVIMGGTGSGRTVEASDQGRKKDSKGASAAEVKKLSKQKNTKESVSEQSYPPSESEMPEISVMMTTQTSTSKTQGKTPSNVSSKRNTPRSKSFEQNVLKSRSIIINQGSIPVTAHAHFDIKEPPPLDITKHEYYTSIRSVSKSTIWVETDAIFITHLQETYREMVNWKMCEAEFATYAKEKLVKRNDSLDKRSRFFQTMRLVELVNKPEQETANWVPPPLTEAPSPANEFAFDLRPDCAYWISLQGTNRNLIYIIEAIIHTIFHHFTSPYLTIEFKKDDQDWKVALNQLAAASALALYNRFCLRQKSFVQGETWTRRRTRVLRHYGLAMRGDAYTVWCTTPRLTEDFTWAGCEMKRIGSGSCSRDNDLHELIHWINEIHCWGLIKHAPRVEKDLKRKIEEHHKQHGGSQPSNIGRDSEDEPDSEYETV